MKSKADRFSGRGTARHAPLHVLVLLLAVSACSGLVGCRRKTAPPATQPHDDRQAARPAASAAPHALPNFEVDAVSASEGNARWYDVPDNSLPQRRAWPGEMTAASDRVPPGKYVRVRRLDGKTGSGADGNGGKGIVVRITDNGLHSKGTIIDLNREAAAALGMVKEGQVRVRVEVLALKNATADKPVDKKDAGPAAPKVSEITDKPVASEKQEKDAANAKTGGQSAP